MCKKNSNFADFFVICVKRAYANARFEHKTRSIKRLKQTTWQSHK